MRSPTFYLLDFLILSQGIGVLAQSQCVSSCNAVDTEFDSCFAENAIVGGPCILDPSGSACRASPPKAQLVDDCCAGEITNTNDRISPFIAQLDGCLACGTQVGKRSQVFLKDWRVYCGIYRDSGYPAATSVFLNWNDAALLSYYTSSVLRTALPNNAAATEGEFLFTPEATPTASPADTAASSTGTDDRAVASGTGAASGSESKLAGTQSTGTGTTLVTARTGTASSATSTTSTIGATQTDSQSWWGVSILIGMWLVTWA